MNYIPLVLGVLLTLGGCLSIYAGYDIIEIERGWAEVIAGTTAATGGVITISLWMILRRLKILSEAYAGVKREFPSVSASAAEEQSSPESVDGLPILPVAPAVNAEPAPADSPHPAPTRNPLPSNLPSHREAPEYDVPAFSLSDSPSKAPLSPFPPAPFPRSSFASVGKSEVQHQPASVDLDDHEEQARAETPLTASPELEVQETGRSEAAPRPSILSRFLTPRAAPPPPPPPSFMPNLDREPLPQITGGPEIETAAQPAASAESLFDEMWKRVSAEIDAPAPKAESSFKAFAESVSSEAKGPLTGEDEPAILAHPEKYEGKEDASAPDISAPYAEASPKTVVAPEQTRPWFRASSLSSSPRKPFFSKPASREEVPAPQDEREKLDEHMEDLQPDWKRDAASRLHSEPQDDPILEHALRPDHFEPESSEAEHFAAESSEAGAAHSSPPPSAEPPAIIGQYESEGTAYVMFADGSIEAQSEAGIFRFASIDDLRAFIEEKQAS